MFVIKYFEVIQFPGSGSCARSICIVLPSIDCAVNYNCIIILKYFQVFKGAIQLNCTLQFLKYVL